MDVVGTAGSRHRARKLRQEMTKPERLLWWALRRNNSGVHFPPPAHGSARCALDFHCDKARPCVEVGGFSHDHEPEQDRRRDAFLRRRFGIFTTRIPASQVLNDPQGVVEPEKSQATTRAMALAPPSACG